MQKSYLLKTISFLIILLSLVGCSSVSFSKQEKSEQGVSAEMEIVSDSSNESIEGEDDNISLSAVGEEESINSGRLLITFEFPEDENNFKLITYYPNNTIERGRERIKVPGANLEVKVTLIDGTNQSVEESIPFILNSNYYTTNKYPFGTFKLEIKIIDKDSADRILYIGSKDNVSISSESTSVDIDMYEKLSYLNYSSKELAGNFGINTKYMNSPILAQIQFPSEHLNWSRQNSFNVSVISCDADYVNYIWDSIKITAIINCEGFAPITKFDLNASNSQVDATLLDDSIPELSPLAISQIPCKKSIFDFKTFLTNSDILSDNGPHACNFQFETYRQSALHTQQTVPFGLNILEVTP